MPHRSTSAPSLAGRRPRRRSLACVAAAGLLATSALAAPIATNITHWAFQPLAAPAIPGKPDSGNPIDAFVAASLVRDGHKLEREADRRALLRRLSFDLRGLPPTSEETAAFLDDRKPDALGRWADRFMDSPGYGEHWGRHWLDIAGYADSNGYFNADSDRPLAWKYRDYVVRSIQADKPFHRFITEQIAGDELAAYVAGGDLTPAQAELLVATGFWRNVPDGTGESDGNPLEVKVDQYAVLEGNVQLIGSAFLGLTLQCARCHAHKFEPVSQQDYYALQGLIRPGFDPARWLKPAERAVEIGTRAEREAHREATVRANREIKTLNSAIEAVIVPFRKQWADEHLEKLSDPLRGDLRKALDTREKDRTDAMKALLKEHAAAVEPEESALTQAYPALAASLNALRDSLKTAEAAKPKPLERIAAFYEGTNTPPEHHLLLRGNHAAEGEAVPAGVPMNLARRVAFKAEPAPSRSTGRRLALAQWLTDANNGLVVRVLVNRVWKYHFGTGIVPTADNLGQSGAKPSDPDLLEWLSTEFVRSGWSLRHLNRLIVTSRTYRQPATAAFPWGGPRRLDAESLRDAMLQVSGELDTAVGGAYVPTRADAEGQIIVDESQPGAHRRSLYLQQRRTMPLNFLATFDGPAFNPVCIQRIPSTVAQQSLSLLNSEFVRQRARAFARRLASEPGAERTPGEATARRAMELAYGRKPTAAELTAAAAFLKEQLTVYAGKDDARDRATSDLCQMILASNAFVYVD